VTTDKLDEKIINKKRSAVEDKKTKFDLYFIFIIISTFIEEDIAVLLVRDEETIKINIPLFLLPPGSREGDILSITITRDVQETEAAKERVSSLLMKLKKRIEPI
jgi:hypothetical protein